MIGSRIMQTSELGLGTAQLGAPYGIANSKGPPSPGEAFEMIQYAFRSGVRYYDTAQAYGQSEAVLGTCLSQLKAEDEVRVISKLHPSLELSGRRALERSVDASLARLDVRTLWGLMLHRAEFLREWDRGLHHRLAELQASGKVKHLGVSVYEPEDAVRALELEGIDLLQVPFNLFDRRLSAFDFFTKAEDLQKTVFVRSIYLQGLVLIDSGALPEQMTFARPALGLLEDFCGKRKLNRKQFALEYVRSRSGSSIPVVGSESIDQIRENIRFWGERAVPEEIMREWDSVASGIPGRLLNPALW